MNFASIDFLIFISIVFPLYLLLSHRGQNRMLLVASYIFYGWWDWRFLSLLWFSTTFDYFVGILLDKIQDPYKRKWCIASSICVNLGILGFFKYFNFFEHSLAELFSKFNIQLGWVSLNIILPVGVSFYTFQSMSYTIDVYCKKMKATYNFFDFALFVAFFPQLLAGPIERAAFLLPKIQRPRHFQLEVFNRGIFLITYGLFKKIVIANGVAPSVNAIYNSTGAVSFIDVVLATYLFAIQIYCDFSGYTDIARGLAKIMGFDLMVNFNLPYFATNPSDFWRRWHISLSSWLRDYLYIPLGGNRKGPSRTYVNLMITMLLGGLWHGAAWSFVLWGFYQGSLLCIHRFFTKKDGEASPSNIYSFQNILCILFFFQVTCYGWLLFRANSSIRS